MFGHVPAESKELMRMDESRMIESKGSSETSKHVYGNA